MKKIFILFLWIVLPFLAYSQAVVQQSKAPSTGINAGNQYFSWYSGLFSGYLSAPIGATATFNRAGGGIAGQFFFQLSDTTIRVWTGSAWLSFGGKGGGSNTLYMNGNEFFGTGSTTLDPISLRFLNTPNGNTGVDSILVIRADGTPGKIPSFTSSGSPNAIISGGIASIFISGIDTSLAINPTTWRINNVIYQTTSSTFFLLPHRDATRSQYGYVYADNTGHLSIVYGALTTTPVPPPIPANTVFVGSVLITPTGFLPGGGGGIDLSGYVQKGIPYNTLTGQYLVGLVDGGGKLVTDSTFKYIFGTHILQLTELDATTVNSTFLNASTYVATYNTGANTDLSMSTNIIGILNGFKFRDDNTGIIQELGWNVTDGAWELGQFPGPYSKILTTSSPNTIVASGQATLSAGTKTITISGLSTSNHAVVSLQSQGGTVTTTVAYEGVCTLNTLTIYAVTNAGGNTINNLDTSVVNYLVIN